LQRALRLLGGNDGTGKGERDWGGKDLKKKRGEKRKKEKNHV